jgi:hypothetical protein
MLGSRKIAAVIAAGALAGTLGVGGAAAKPRHHAPGVLLKAAAQYLGLERAALVQDIRSGRTLAQVATNRGKTVSGLEAAMVAAAKAKLDAAVSAGKLSAAQEQARLARVQKQVKRLVNAKLARRVTVRASFLARAAKYIGVAPKALRAELEGKSLAQVAAAHGKTAAGLEAALLKPFKTRLDKSVAAGRLSAAEAQARLAKVSERIEAAVTRVR